MIDFSVISCHTKNVDLSKINEIININKGDSA